MEVAKGTTEMDNAIFDQHARLDALAAALERTLVVASDVDLVRDPLSSQRQRLQHHTDAALMDAALTGGQHDSPNCNAPTSDDDRRQWQHPHSLNNVATSVVPGGHNARRRQTPRGKGLRQDATVALDFSSADCLPSKVPTPFRPSFYTAQFRASSREAFTPSKVMFAEGRSQLVSSGDPLQPNGTSSSPTRHGGEKVAASRSALKTDAESCDASLLQVRQEQRVLESLRQQLQAETVRLTQLAQRVRAEHAQVQRRSEALVVKEKELHCREQAMEKARNQWHEELSNLKRQYTNGLRVASAVNRRLREDLQDASPELNSSSLHSVMSH